MDNTEMIPLFRLPFVDLGAVIVSHQYGKCAKRELKAMSCLEAYGIHDGKIKCAELISDYQECFINSKQLKRAKYMRYIRYKQYLTGKRDKLWTEDPPASTTFHA